MRLLAAITWPFGWGATLVSLIGGMVLSFLLFGYFYDYWLYADQDLVLAYQGLLYNSGLPQEYVDHPGYLSYLLIGSWYRLLHGLGLLQVHALSDMPPAADGPASAAAWQALVRAGRALSLLTTVLFTLIFAALMRHLLCNWRVALMAATAFAFSGGVIFQARIMRTELLAGGLVVTGLLLFLLSATEGRTRWRPALAGLGVFCVVLAMENKIQALLPILAMPVLVLALGCQLGQRGESYSPWAAARWAWPVAIVLAAIAVALAMPAAGLVARGDADASITPYPAVALAGVYQGILALWFLGAMLASMAWRRVPLSESVATLACAAAGCALGLLVLLIRPNDQNIIALTHPVEHLAAFVVEKYRVPVLSQSLITAILSSGLGDVLWMHSVGLRLTRPTVILEWFLVAAAFVAWRRGERRLPLGIALVLATVMAIETVFALRGLKPEYFIFTEPLVIIAAAIAFTRLSDALLYPALPVLASCALAVVVAWGIMGSARMLFHHGEPRHAWHTDDVCEWAPFYMTRIERVPFCPAQACWGQWPYRTCWQGQAWDMGGGGIQ